MFDVMLDIETLDTKTDAVVLTIAAVKFDLKTNDTFEDILNDNGRWIHLHLSAANQEDKGRSVSQETINWWKKQSEDAKLMVQASFEHNPYIEPEKILPIYASFVAGRRVWGNGNMFDNAIVRSLFETYQMTCPTSYKNDMDYRTLRMLANTFGEKMFIDTPPGCVAHNALHDAIFQVLEAQSCYRHINREAGFFEDYATA